MVEPLETILTLATMRNALLAYADTVAWPDKVLDLFEQKGIICRASDATHIRCPECMDGHSVEVVEQQYLKSQRRQVIICPEAGLIPIDPKHVQQWRVDPIALATAVAQALSIADEPEILIPDRAWYLGSITIDDRALAFVVSRELNGLDSTPGINPGKTVVFGLCDIPSRPPSFAGALPLGSVFRIRSGKFAIDRNRLALAIRDDELAADKPLVDHDTMTISYHGRSCSFSGRAKQLFALFDRLNQKPGRRVSYDTLRLPNEVFGDYPSQDSSIRSAVKRLRDQLKRAEMTGLSECLKTSTVDGSEYVVLDLTAYNRNSH